MKYYHYFSVLCMLIFSFPAFSESSIGFKKVVGDDDMLYKRQEAIVVNTSKTAAGLKSVEAKLNEVNAELNSMTALSRNIQRVLDKQSLIQKSQADIQKNQESVLKEILVQLKKQNEFLERLVIQSEQKSY